MCFRNLKKNVGSLVNKGIQISFDAKNVELLNKFVLDVDKRGLGQIKWVMSWMSLKKCI
jgi:hypothetical protein